MKALLILLSIAGSVAFAQDSNRLRYPITETIVANCLRTSGISVTPSQITLPMNLTAATPEPQLDIAATQKIADGEVRLELRCHRLGDCVAFDALVHAQDVKAIPAEVKPERTPNPLSNDRNLANGTGKSGVRAGAEDRTSSYLRVGAQAVLVIEDGQMRIHLPVIAMSSGSIGGRIQVCTLDRKKTFQAVVVDEGVVKGIIE